MISAQRSKHTSTHSLAPSLPSSLQPFLVLCRKTIIPHVKIQYITFCWKMFSRNMPNVSKPPMIGWLSWERSYLPTSGWVVRFLVPWKSPWTRHRNPKGERRKLELTRCDSMPPLISQFSYDAVSNQSNFKSKWTLVPNLKKSTYRDITFTTIERMDTEPKNTVPPFTALVS